MTTDDEAAIRLADTARGQYFLSAPEKLAMLVKAAGILPTDRVVEIGAGIGTVARALPPSASLTLVELDHRFTDILRAEAPHATVIQGDALAMLPSIPCDVLLSNLPRAPTRALVELLPEIPLRTAVIAMGENPELKTLRPHFTITVVTTVGGDDFKPPQPVRTLLVKLDRLSWATMTAVP